MNIFEKASKQKLRFDAAMGKLNTEQLWDLDLNTLDVIARAVNIQLKSVTEDSFITVKPDSRKPGFQLKLAILKHIINVKLQSQEDAKTAASNKIQKQKLVEALGLKEAETLSQKSEKELKKDIKALS